MKVKEKEKTELKGIVKDIYKTMGQATMDYGMLSDGDRVLVAVKGSPDSLALLKLFQMRQARVPIDFQILACFLNINVLTVNQRILINYFETQGVQYLTEELTLDEREGSLWCSPSFRKVLFELSIKHNCNKLALGHTIDDIIEATLMNLFFNARVNTMKPKVDIFDDLTLIRPLCYVEKKRMQDLASDFSIPDTKYQCFLSKGAEHKIIKNVIRYIDKEHPSVKKNIFRAPERIKKDYLL